MVNHGLFVRPGCGFARDFAAVGRPKSLCAFVARAKNDPDRSCDRQTPTTRHRTATPGGRLTLRRSYVFDYTPDGVTRLQGFVILCGRDLEAVGLAPDRRAH